jgi:hypothetical protein
MRWTQWLHGFMLAAAWLIPALGFCQESKGKPAEIKADLPGPIHKQLDVLAGKWDVEVAYVVGGKENKGKAQCETRWILDGRFLQQDYTSNLMGKPFFVLQLVGYDNHKKKTIEIMMDSLSTGARYNEGSISADGKTITKEGERVDPATGKKLKLRTVTTIIDVDHYTLEWFTRGESGKDEKVVSMTHSRRKP